MKILITGNMGYVGPGVVKQLRASYPDAMLIGYDMAYFASHLTGSTVLPESQLDVQLFGDVRTMQFEILNGIDAVVHLAAISNDPMGSLYEDITLEVNYKASIKIAHMAKIAGAKSFVFASSCSMYGAAGDSAKTEQSSLNPLTAYARSKALTEQDLAPLADDSFTVTCLRFATACGMSDRLRLDLVLNDFVAGAVVTGEISILSDGSPWRPLIHVKDMARAIDWAISRSPNNGGSFLAVNAGSNSWNHQVIDLAYAVTSVIKNTKVTLNTEAPPDKRSYRVDFSLFKLLAPDHQPLYTLKDTIRELVDGLTRMQFKNADYRTSNLMRLQVLNSLQREGLINKNFSWAHQIIKLTETQLKLETT